MFVHVEIQKLLDMENVNALHLLHMPLNVQGAMSSCPGVLLTDAVSYHLYLPI